MQSNITPTKAIMHLIVTTPFIKKIPLTTFTKIVGNASSDSFYAKPHPRSMAMLDLASVIAGARVPDVGVGGS